METQMRLKRLKHWSFKMKQELVQPLNFERAPGGIIGIIYIINSMLLSYCCCSYRCCTSKAIVGPCFTAAFRPESKDNTPLCVRMWGSTWTDFGLADDKKDARFKLAGGHICSHQHEMEKKDKSRRTHSAAHHWRGTAGGSTDRPTLVVCVPVVLHLWLFEDIPADGVEVAQVFEGGDVLRHSLDHHLAGR